MQEIAPFCFLEIPPDQSHTSLLLSLQKGLAGMPAVGVGALPQGFRKIYARNIFFYYFLLWGVGGEGECLQWDCDGSGRWYSHIH